MILLEESDGTSPVYIATESSMTEEIDTLREIEILSDGNYQLILENEFGSHENGFLVYEPGGITLESGTDADGSIIFEDDEKLLLEDGVEDKIDLIQPHVAASVRATHSLTNTGDSLNEGSFLTTGIGNRTYGSVTLSDDGGLVATGTVTQFEFDFNNLIVLEGIGTLGVVELESATPEENARLCHIGLHDLILEEEGILQEAVDQIKLDTETLENITQEEFTIGQFVPFLGFEPHDDLSITIDDNMLLESVTHKTTNVCVEAEDGDLIVQEDDGSSHIVLDDFYFKYWGEGTITQVGTTITLSGSIFPFAVVDGGRFFYQNGVESTDIVSISADLMEIVVENSTTISSAENYKVGYSLDDTLATTDAFIVMEGYSFSSITSETNAKFERDEIFLNGYTRGDNNDAFGTGTLNIAAFYGAIGNNIVYEDGVRILSEDGIGGYIAFEDLGNDHGRVLNEDDTGCFFASEDFEAQTDQDDNVMMKEQSDGLLLESSETEVPYHVLSEDAGQMMLEEVFQVSEYKIVLDSNDYVLIEDQPAGDNWNYKLLNLDMERFDIAAIANNTSMTLQSTEFFGRSDSAILVSRTEQIT